MIVNAREGSEQLVPLIQELALHIDDMPAGEDLHPKVCQVSAQKVLLFKNKVFSTMNILFFNDNDEFYVQVTTMLSTILREVQVSEWYLHQLYPRRRKSFLIRLTRLNKGSINYTLIIKLATDRSKYTEAVYQAYDNYEKWILKYRSLTILREHQCCIR